MHLGQDSCTNLVLNQETESEYNSISQLVTNNQF